MTAGSLNGGACSPPFHSKLTDAGVNVTVIVSHSGGLPPVHRVSDAVSPYVTCDAGSIANDTGRFAQADTLSPGATQLAHGCGPGLFVDGTTNIDGVRIETNPAKLIPSTT
jgi:hypothetical protein